MTRHRGNDPEPGETVALIDGGETRVRQVLSSDDRLGIFEVKDDRGQIIFIGEDVPGLWIQLTEV